MLIQNLIIQNQKSRKGAQKAMFGQTAVGNGGINSAASRIYRYEVVGLRQNNENDKNSYDIRNSASVFITVPYSRMNEEMRRITRMGGTIVKIEALTTA
jgi:phycocyanin-associated rod protein